MDIVIVGAGIGGLALARAVRGRHGVRVLERASATRTGGAAVTVFSNGAAAAEFSGVPLRGLGGRIDLLEFRLADGRTFGRTDLRVPARRTGYPVATVPRAELLARLGAGVDVTYDRQVVAVDGTTVTDASGERHTGDVLVGADGHRSVVRRATLGERAAAGTQWTSWQGLTETLPGVAGTTRALCVVGDAGLCGMMPAGNGLLQWWFDTPSTMDEAELRARFGRYCDPVPELLASVSEFQVFPHVVHEVPDRWGRGATTLLGDAAHAFPPSQAQGANQALEDACVLGRALLADGPLEDRLRAYERGRARRVRLVSRLAASEVTNKVPGGLGRLVGRLLTPRLAGWAHLTLMRRYSSVL